MLLAEDDRAIRHALERALTLQGYEVTAVADGDEALAQAHRTEPDVLVLDVMMPGMDGPAILARMRADPDLRHIPVIFMTAKADPREVARFRALSAIGVIAKPFDPMALGTQVRALWNAR